MNMKEHSHLIVWTKEEVPEQDFNVISWLFRVELNIPGVMIRYAKDRAKVAAYCIKGGYFMTLNLRTILARGYLEADLKKNKNHLMMNRFLDNWSKEEIR